MHYKKYFYLINIQFIGFRYGGWQKQSNCKTVQGMIDKTFSYIFSHENFKTLGAGRTDAKVSANQFSFQLFCQDKIDEIVLLKEMNINLPADIKVLNITQVDKSFRVINDVKSKEYLYLFTYGGKMNPLYAPYMAGFQEILDINLMKKGAKLFVGFHNFKNFCFRPTEYTELERVIEQCEIIPSEEVENNYNTLLSPRTWILRISGSGFLRHQIRLIMGSLVKLGQNKISLEDIQSSLKGDEMTYQSFTAPGSGLTLNKVIY